MVNTLTTVVPKLLARGLLALREMAIMPQLVNREYESMAGMKGSTIDVPIPSAVAVADVTPAATAPSTADTTLSTVPIALTRWKEAAFHISDKDRLEIEANDNFFPMQASEAIKGLANEIDSYLLGLATKFFNQSPPTEGFTTGKISFGGSNGIRDTIDPRTKLNQSLAPFDPRYMVVDPIQEGSALELRAFHDASFSNSAAGILEGQINRKLGFGWFMDQNVQSFTPGGVTGDPDVNGAETIGTKSITVDCDADDTIELHLGDVITFSNHSQQYVVTTALTVANSASGTLTIEPGLTTALAGAETFDVETGVVDGTAYNVGAAFHRDAIAFATRPLLSSSHPSSVFSQAVDPVSGIALRLEVTREHKRDRYAYDILYGGDVVRRELGCRVSYVP